MKYDASTPLGLSWAGYTRCGTRTLGSARDGRRASARRRPRRRGAAVVGDDRGRWRTWSTWRSRACSGSPRSAGRPARGRSWAEYRTRLGAQGPLLRSLGVNYYRAPEVPWSSDESVTSALKDNGARGRLPATTEGDTNSPPDRSPPMHRIRLLVPLLAVAVLLCRAGARPRPRRASSSARSTAAAETAVRATRTTSSRSSTAASAADLTGWSVQYASAASTSWSVTALAGSIQPGHYYLVQLASPGSVGAALPTPDTTGTTNIANSGGKVALVSAATALACGARPGVARRPRSVVDLVGYGSAADYEGSGARAGLSSATAAIRAGNGCTDTGSSSADFAAIAPSPRNSSTTAVTARRRRRPTANVSEDAGGRRRHPAGALPHAGAADDQLRHGRRRRHTSPGLRTRHGGQQQRDRLRAQRPPDGVHAGRPAAGDLGHGTFRRDDRAALAGGALAGIPIAPTADLTIGTSVSAQRSGGDVWPTSIAFSSPIPTLAPGHYSGPSRTR